MSPCRLLCRFSDAGVTDYRRDLLAGFRKAPRHEIALRHQAAIEDVDYRAARGLDRALLNKLAEGSWIDAHNNDPTYADAILDRIVHNAHRINLIGHSLRPSRASKASISESRATSSRNAPAALSESARCAFPTLRKLYNP